MKHSPVIVSNRSAPLVSVIVPTRNRPTTLLEALRSIIAQTYPHFEIIVVNDAGSDPSSMIDSLDAGEKITLLTHSNARGAPGARNTALGVAHGKYIAYLDDDDLFYPEHLETLVSFLESGDDQVAYTDAYRAYRIFENGEYVVQKRGIPYSYDFDVERLLVWNISPVNCFMHPRSCLAAVGLFDEKMAPIEDWDFWIRLSRKYPFAHIKKVTCEVSWRFDGTSLTSARRADFIRATRILYEKHRVFAQAKPNVVKAQKKNLEYLDKLFSDEVRIQNLVERSFAEEKNEDPLIRDLMSLALMMREKNLEDQSVIDYQGARIKELEEFVDRVRQNPVFRAYHWLKYRGHE